MSRRVVTLTSERARRVRASGTTIGKSELSTEVLSPVTEAERHHLISAKAYARFEQRGFTHGHDLDDWLETEAEMNQMPATRH
jgi:hypothetical protein